MMLLEYYEVVKRQENAKWQVYDSLREFIDKNIDNYEAFETGIKKLLCRILPTQQLFTAWKLYEKDLYKRLKFVECVTFLSESNQLNGVGLIITCRIPEHFTFFTDRKIIQINK